MRYFIVLRAIYLTVYYLKLTKQPSRLYALSVMMASSSGIAFTLFILFLLIFGNTDSKTRFPFESLLFHGLSYEEWRTASEVKKNMDKVEMITKKEKLISLKISTLFFYWFSHFRDSLNIVQKPLKNDLSLCLGDFQRKAKFSRHTLLTFPRARIR
jgi:hypothetical protein